MKQEHKVWWEGIADQYEEWASNPPTFSLNNHEFYTCSGFYDDFIPWGFCDAYQFEDILKGLFKVAGYSSLAYPIGCIGDRDRETKREAFFQDMADTIRENIQ